MRHDTWLALQVYTGQELSIRDRWLRDGLGVFCPTYRLTVRWSDRTKFVDRALLPGYIFLPSSQRHTSAVERCSQLVRILTDEISAAEIQRLRDLERLEARPAPQTEAGARVEIRDADSCLHGIQGRVVRSKPRRNGIEHVIIAVEILNRSVEVEVDACHLRALH
jgi:transcription antitermination factor NusG